MVGIEVRSIQRSDIPHLADVLARAFDKDPVMSWVTRQDEDRIDALRDLYTHSIEEDLRWGWETTTTDLRACAVWIPPESMLEKPRPFNAIFSLPRYIRWCGISRLGRWLSFLDLCEKKRPKTPHHYLDFIGVHPGSQGQGYASALLRHTLTLIDHRRESAYLESSSPRNTPLYQRHGFKIIDEIHLPDGPTLWCMWRETSNNTTCNTL
jgi:ribosomal protein S18 acetylase RimI-like enzyme